MVTGIIKKILALIFILDDGSQLPEGGDFEALHCQASQPRSSTAGKTSLNHCTATFG
jgi:hypothetical protein